MSTPWDDAPAYMDFEEPEGFDEQVAKGRKRPESGRGHQKKRRDDPTEPGSDLSALIPVLPPPEKPLTGDQVRRGVSNRDRSAANLKLDGASYADIAEVLDFKSPMDAKRAVERALAATHSPEDWETLRMIAAARAERLFARSSAMAAADFLVDLETNTKILNGEKLRWHQQAGADLMNLVTITGAKAAAKLEITPDEERMDQLVSQIMEQLGHEEIVEAEVLELTQIPSEPEEEDGW